MKKLKLLLSLSILTTTIGLHCVYAQGISPLWQIYMSNDYIYNVQESYHSEGNTVDEFLNRLSDIAVTNVARTIKTKIHDTASVEKQSDNGKTSIAYSSSTTFATDINISLIETRTYFDTASGYGAAIAYINKTDAIEFYCKSLKLAIDDAWETLFHINKDIENGLKIKAKADTESALSELDEKHDIFYYLMFFGIDNTALDTLTCKYSEVCRNMRNIISELRHGTTICIICQDKSDDEYGLSHSIRGNISPLGCNFTDNKSEADWIVTICIESEDYNCAEFSGIKVYTSHATAEVKITNGITARTIMSDDISESGSHTIGYENAKKEAYEKLASNISKIIMKYIGQL